MMQSSAWGVGGAQHDARAVQDAEVGVARYVSPEEAAAAARAASVAAAAGDGAAAVAAARALADMMGGALDATAAAVACAAPQARPAWMAGDAAAFTAEQTREVAPAAALPQCPAVLFTAQGPQGNLVISAYAPRAGQARAWEERERGAAAERERLHGLVAAEARGLQAAAAEAIAGVDEAIAALDQVRAARAPNEASRMRRAK